MIYNITDNRVSIDYYFFEMDTENNIHIYSKGMKYLTVIEIGYYLDFEQFKEICNQWFLENN